MKALSAASVSKNFKPKQKIKYDEVTIKVPTCVMDVLWKTEDNVIEWIEQAVVETLCAENEGKTPQEWADLFNLTPVFREDLDRAYYKTED